MTGQDFIERLKLRFGDKVTAVNLEAIDPWVEVVPTSLVEICVYLRDESDLRFNMLNCITGIDYFEPDPKKAAKSPWEPHIEVVYHLSSIPHKHTIVVKVKTSRWKNDVEGELPELPTVSHVWQTANWHEREVYDLVGVQFVGHPNLRRILCPEDWVGYPLRKDYEMPLEYHGMRGR